uniref:Uncharacterized protein n=1 Tax=Panagrolaimus sp. ES5 TaxID=591445 RepID=A0AC34FKP3_9BILA
MASILNNESDGNVEHSTVKDAIRNIFKENEDEEKNQDGIHDNKNSSNYDNDEEKFDYSIAANVEKNDNGDSFGMSDKSDSKKIDVNYGSGGTYLSGSSDFIKNND